MLFFSLWLILLFQKIWFRLVPTCLKANLRQESLFTTTSERRKVEVQHIVQRKEQKYNSFSAEARKHVFAVDLALGAFIPVLRTECGLSSRSLHIPNMIPKRKFLNLVPGPPFGYSPVGLLQGVLYSVSSELKFVAGSEGYVFRVWASLPILRCLRSTHSIARGIGKGNASCLCKRRNGRRLSRRWSAWPFRNPVSSVPETGFWRDYIYSASVLPYQRISSPSGTVPEWTHRGYAFKRSAIQICVSSCLKSA